MNTIDAMAQDAAPTAAPEYSLEVQCDRASVREETSVESDTPTSEHTATTDGVDTASHATRTPSGDAPSGNAPGTDAARDDMSYKTALEDSLLEVSALDDGPMSDGTLDDGTLDDGAIEDDGRVRFHDLNLPPEICSALKKSGYTHPTDIQAATIPALLKGRDVLGQAQTGTGKTAAFALPLLSRIDVDVPETQVLVLTPTRELAIQVAESFLKYGQHLRGLRVAPIYGGSSYATQIHALRRGAHVVVGTPGRVMDHMRETRLRIDTLQCLVLDEADEMLRMGFVDDVQWILEQSPADRQIALFSATMPDAIRQIANRHLKNPHVISVASKQRTADNIQQHFVLIDPRHKLESLQRILEAEVFDGMIVFVKTKIATVELADRLKALGYAAVALNGDIAQTQRERTIEQLKDGTIHILVATDVAARGLDVQRISHVINYDLPADAEAYVHRIGRTGRAGRDGRAILFVPFKQRGLLREFDRASGQSIEPMEIPTAKEINALRVTRFKEGIVNTCSTATEASPRGDLFRLFEKLIGQCAKEQGLDPLQVAAGLATLSQGDLPFFVNETPVHTPSRDNKRFDRDGGNSRDRDGGNSRERNRPARGEFQSDRGPRNSPPQSDAPSDSRGLDPALGSKRSRKRFERDTMDLELAGIGTDRETFRVEVGKVHGVRPGNLVGAVANEIGLDSNLIGPIRIHHEFSTIDLPAGMPREAFKVLGRAWVLGRQLRISKNTDYAPDRKPYRSANKRKPQ